MLNLQKSKRVRRMIRDGEHPHATLAVWVTAMEHARWGDMEVQLSRTALAKEAGVTVDQVTRSMKLLEKYGAVIVQREAGRVRYYCDPVVGSFGGGKGKQMSTYQAVALTMQSAFEQVDKELSRETGRRAFPE